MRGCGRVSFDLTGLPPTPDELADFVGDASPLAHERVVDRLLASPAFGERWARHWLDLVGYADEIGTSNNIFAEHAWRYRDYVIESFNADKPFNRFLREQIAGDLLPHNSDAERAANLTATGFLLLGDLSIVEADKAKLRVDTDDQQVDKIGRAMLGMTLGCARCHDHKFDPISQRDYYALAGILDGTESVHKAVWGVWSFPLTAELPESKAQRSERDTKTTQHRQRIESLRAERNRVRDRQTKIDAALKSNAPPAGGPTRTALEGEKQELEARCRKLDAELMHAEYFVPAIPQVFAVRDRPDPHDMRVTMRGNPHALGDLVPRGFPRAIAPQRSDPVPVKQSGRLQLAEWITSRDNPLTARVAVNRIWQKLFGEGIVRSVDYFGLRGETPSHPELLDYLAVRFMAGNWSQKRLIRELVLSRAYRMSSRHDPRAQAVDPGNRWLWRMHRRRLDAEALRDALLAVSGRLVRSSGGPPLPLEYVENIGNLQKGDVNPPSFNLSRFRPEQEYLRTIYLPIIRSGPQPGPAEIRNLFDFTQPAEMAGRAQTTTVPTQALFLMNSRPLKSCAAIWRCGFSRVLASNPNVWPRCGWWSSAARSPRRNRPTAPRFWVQSGRSSRVIRESRPINWKHARGRNCATRCWPRMSFCFCCRSGGTCHERFFAQRPLPAPFVAADDLVWIWRIGACTALLSQSGAGSAGSSRRRAPTSRPQRTAGDLPVHERRAGTARPVRPEAIDRRKARPADQPSHRRPQDHRRRRSSIWRSPPKSRSGHAANRE